MATAGFEGMDALIAGLGRMGETVQHEASGIVRATAQLMRATVQSKYPRKSGVLQDRVIAEESSAPGPSLRWKVRSKAPHAHLFEEGTVERFLASNGASRGRMPATPTFVPEAVAARGRMRRQLIDLVNRQTVPHMTGRAEVRET